MKKKELKNSITNFSYLNICFYKFLENSSKIFDEKKSIKEPDIYYTSFENDNFSNVIKYEDELAELYRISDEAMEKKRKNSLFIIRPFIK